MIFAHAPAGFLAAWLTKRFWQKDKLSKKQLTILYSLTIIGGLFPDIDLFYYYLVDASASHREFFTHSAIFYLLIFILFYLWAWHRKSKYGQIAISLFILGVFTHLITDSLGVIALFYPLTREVFGFSQASWFSQSSLGQNLFVVNYILEIFIITQAVIAFVWLLFKNKIFKYFVLFFCEGLFILGIIGILILNQHIFKGPSSVYYGDLDQDGIMNKQDDDMDGDGVLNFQDADADGDNYDNISKVLEKVKECREVWHDPTEGGFLEIPLRIGLVTNSDFIRRVFEQSGIYFRAEMSKYDDLPVAKDKSSFDREISNWKEWLEREQRLLDSQIDNYQLGEVVFYGQRSDEITHVAIVMEITEELVMVADVTPEKNVRIVSEAVVMQEFGPAQYLGKIYAN